LKKLKVNSETLNRLIPRQPSKLTLQEHAAIIRSLRKKLKVIDKELSQSPCIYREWKEMADCRHCRGFRKGCKARRPEALYKNKNGNWKRN